MSDRVIAAWCERASGPGWASQLVVVLVETRATGALRLEYLQPSEWGRHLDVAMFDVGATVSAALKVAAEKALYESLLRREFSRDEEPPHG